MLSEGDERPQPWVDVDVTKVGVELVLLKCFDYRESDGERRECYQFPWMVG